MKNIIKGVAIFLIGAILFSCAKVGKIEVPQIKPVASAGPLYQIQISPNSPKTTVGGTVTLTAKGVDKEGREVSINPTWKSDAEGEVSPNVGKTVTFQALKSGVCFVEVREGNISATVGIEIK